MHLTHVSLSASSIEKDIYCIETHSDCSLLYPRARDLQSAVKEKYNYNATLYICVRARRKVLDFTISVTEEILGRLEILSGKYTNKIQVR